MGRVQDYTFLDIVLRFAVGSMPVWNDSIASFRRLSNEFITKEME